MKKRNTTSFFVLLFIIGIQFGNAISYAFPPSKTLTTAPTITATGNFSYCPQTETKIVSTVHITFDPSEPSTDAVYIQIASGYSQGNDVLSLSNQSAHPNIKSSWNTTEGKLILSGLTATDLVSYTDFELAIKDVVFKNTSLNPTGTRSFSISLGNGRANYLPRNGHYYEFIPSLRTSWSNARNAATTQRFYGLQGYLATLTAADEAQLAGKQAPGSGWIGGSDEETEGVWKWMSGPEAGQTMSFTFWNSGEPNDFGGNEDYAHITAPGVGTRGSWNDLPNNGGSGDYEAKGYIVEYGGMPGDPVLQLSASTSLTVLEITTTIPASRCDSGSVTLQATATSGTINWFDTQTGSTVLATSSIFNTPIINATKDFFAEISTCPSTRTKVTATVITSPTISTLQSSVSRCGDGSVVLEATTTNGIINWFSVPTAGNPLQTTNRFTTPNLSETTIFYAEAVDANCKSANRLAIEVKINPVPLVNDETSILCESSSLILDAGLSGFAYLWSTTETTKSINVSAPGAYSVILTNPLTNCSSTKKIDVQEHSIPKIEEIVVEDTSVTIQLKNPSNYFEFSIDGGNFSPTNQFLNLGGSLHFATAREIYGCGSDTKTFVVLVAKPFFTPNNDNHNDFWTVEGIQYFPNAILRIFDRYGKFIKEISPTSQGWDGTYIGTPLPADDYWYSYIKDNASNELRGHFSLKR